MSIYLYFQLHEPRDDSITFTSPLVLLTLSLPSLIGSTSHWMIYLSGLCSTEIMSSVPCLVAWRSRIISRALFSVISKTLEIALLHPDKIIRHNKKHMPILFHILFHSINILYKTVYC